MFPEGRIFEFMIVGAVALIVVGPKDLPVLMRRVGRFIAHLRSMAAEFRASFDEMARQSELDELRKEVEALRTGQSLHAAVGLGPDSGVQDVLDDIHSGLHGADAPLPSSMTPLPEVVPSPTAEQAGPVPTAVAPDATATPSVRAAS